MADASGKEANIPIQNGNDNIMEMNEEEGGLITCICKKPYFFILSATRSKFNP